MILVFQKLRKLKFVAARAEFLNKHAKKQEDSGTASMIFKVNLFSI